MIPGMMPGMMPSMILHNMDFFEVRLFRKKFRKV